MKTQKYPLTETGQLNPLAADYLRGLEALNDFYSFKPSADAISLAIEGRKKHPVDRQRLADVLASQYEQMQQGFAEQEGNTSVRANIQSLRSENTFTITTGHQLNVLTGPLFFHYKIISAITYAYRLKALYPEYNFVPVYWMASEDHDFAEIKDVHLMGRTLSWDAPAGGPVGRMSTATLAPLLDELDLMAQGRDALAPLLETIRQAYLGQPNLSQATRSLVHNLYKEYGLVILDADDARLKQALIPVLEADMLACTVYPAVSRSIQELQQSGYEKLPVSPRAINVFYIGHGGRTRIVKDEAAGVYRVLDTDISWTEEALRNAIRENPKDFSPNVVLRPMYQEMILPNLAYIGGNNEIAYWLELKAAFDALDIFFPQLLVRDSALWLGKRAAKDLRSLQLEPQELLRSEKDLEALFYDRFGLEHPAESEIGKLQEQLNILRLSLQQGLTAGLVSGIVKQINQYQKDIKSWKTCIRQEIAAQEEKNLDKLRKLRELVFPDGDFQERHDNFIPLWLQYGPDWIAPLLESFDPTEGMLHIVVSE